MTVIAVSDKKDLRTGLLKEAGPYRLAAGRFLDFLESEGYGIGDLEGWEAYQDRLSKQRTGKRHKKISASTYNYNIQAMKRCLKYALDHAEAELTVAQKFEIEKALQSIKRKKQNPPDIKDKVLSKEEVDLFLGEARRPRWGLDRKHPRPDVALWFEFLYHSACRVSEMLNIELADLTDCGNHYAIRIPDGKGGIERTHPGVSKELVDRCKAHFGGSAYLFECRNGGRDGKGDHRFSRQYVSMNIHNLAKRILKKDISAHSLRHTRLTHLGKETGRYKAVQNFAGHRSFQTTMRYYMHDSFSFSETQIAFG